MPQSHDDLLKEIMARRKALQAAPQQDALAQVLDAVNAFDTLDALQSQIRLCYGPKVISSAAPSKGVVIWQRPPGYHGYKVLTLIGVWARLIEDTPQIVVGSKRLAFSAPFYDADAYHKLIRRSYDLYYQDDKLPPRDPAFSAPYAADLRLELRRTVARTLAELV